MKTVHKKRSFFKFLACIVALTFLVSACAKKVEEKVILEINDYTLTAGEFEEVFGEFSLQEDTPEGRRAFLENLITRKLLLLEGQKEGLDKEKEFLKAVENFWEQSLLKIVIDKKVKGIAPQLRASEKEIEDYYARWAKKNPDDTRTLEDLREVIGWQIVKKKQSQVLNAWTNSMRKKADIKIDEEAIGIK